MLNHESTSLSREIENEREEFGHVSTPEVTSTRKMTEISQFTNPFDNHPDLVLKYRGYTIPVDTQKPSYYEGKYVARLSHANVEAYTIRALKAKVKGEINHWYEDEDQAVAEGVETTPTAKAPAKFASGQVFLASKSDISELKSTWFSEGTEISFYPHNPHADKYYGAAIKKINVKDTVYFIVTRITPQPRGHEVVGYFTSLFDAIKPAKKSYQESCDICDEEGLLDDPSPAPGITFGFQKSDGGRRDAGYKATKGVGDCAVIAISNFSGLPYKQVYKNLYRMQKIERENAGKTNKSPMYGTLKCVSTLYLKQTIGARYIPLPRESGKIAPRYNGDYIPSKGAYIVSCKGHLSCVIDGVIHDGFDASKQGMAQVYGYWMLPEGYKPQVQEKYLPGYVKPKPKTKQPAEPVQVDTAWLENSFINTSEVAMLMYPNMTPHSARSYLRIKIRGIRKWQPEDKVRLEAIKRQVMREVFGV